MQIKNQINILRYGIISFLHIIATFYYFGNGNELVLSLCFLSYFLNHLCLILALLKILNTTSEERDNLMVFLLFAAKFLILAGGLWYGVKNFNGNDLIIIGNYIIQLIILILSIKRLR